MKKVVLLATAALVLIGLNSYGQDPDTSKIRVGNKKYTVIIDDDKEVKILTDQDSNVIIDSHREGKKHEHSTGHKMNGTWGGFEIGLANFVNTDYKMTMPAGGEFMDLKVANSMDFNFNFAEKSAALILALG